MTVGIVIGHPEDVVLLTYTPTDVLRASDPHHLCSHRCNEAASVVTDLRETETNTCYGAMKTQIHFLVRDGMGMGSGHEMRMTNKPGCR